MTRPVGTPLLPEDFPNNSVDSGLIISARSDDGWRKYDFEAHCFVDCAPLTMPTEGLRVTVAPHRPARAYRL